MEGMREAIAFAQGEDVPGLRVHIPTEIDVRAIRGKLGQTQAEFAERHGFSLGAVRDWEQGRRVPDQAARAFLKVIANAPGVVEHILKTG
ncbi:MAG TPA: helix-turn-helix domain-containing protein [Caulobacteraceae bacterium]|nr:helix-turn-helix domain-containing protein [Caulobacteraceae bacterium]